MHWVAQFLPLLPLATVLGGTVTVIAARTVLSGRLVYLTCFDGEIRRGRRRRDRNGVFWTYVYPLTGVGHVVLLPSGRTDGESGYIRAWSYRKPPSFLSIEVRNSRFVPPQAESR